MSKPLVSIICVVFNGEKYLRQCLNSIRQQEYENVEVFIFDNNSNDRTAEIAKGYSEFKYIKSPTNLGMWPGQEKVISQAKGEIIVSISVDIIIEPDFIAKCVEKMLSDEKIGAIQGKIYQYKFDREDKPILDHKIIDTCGFRLYHSRKLENIGHGLEDGLLYSKEAEIFGVEGAVPVFRKSALEDIKINGNFIDNDYFWYADDFDFAWRLNILGWKQVFIPDAIAHHDRQTSKNHRSSNLNFIKIRRQIPLFKRRLDYRNTIFTIVKNDYVINVIKDIFPILIRQFELWVYFIFFETSMIFEIPVIIKKLPTLIAKRRQIMSRAKKPAKEFYKCLK